MFSPATYARPPALASTNSHGQTPRLPREILRLALQAASSGLLDKQQSSAQWLQVIELCDAHGVALADVLLLPHSYGRTLGYRVLEYQDWESVRLLHQALPDGTFGQHELVRTAHELTLRPNSSTGLAPLTVELSDGYVAAVYAPNDTERAQYSYGDSICSVRRGYLCPKLTQPQAQSGPGASLPGSPSERPSTPFPLLPAPKRSRALKHPRSENQLKSSAEAEAEHRRLTRLAAGPTRPPQSLYSRSFQNLLDLFKASHVTVARPDTRRRTHGSRQ